jgi:hypothetical protein
LKRKQKLLLFRAGVVHYGEYNSANPYEKLMEKNYEETLVDLSSCKRLTYIRKNRTLVIEGNLLTLREEGFTDDDWQSLKVAIERGDAMFPLPSCCRDAAPDAEIRGK